jgi:hypothetical protein
MKPEVVTALQEFASSRVGKTIMGHLQDEFARGVVELLYCQQDEVEARRGQLRQLHEFMTDTVKADKAGNTHGAS